MFRIRHRKAVASCAAVAILASFLTLVLTHSGGAKPRPAPLPPGQIVLSSGTYATAINIHNPSFRETITLYKRAVVALPESSGKGPAPSKFRSYSLSPGYAVEVDCTDIETLLGPDDGGALIKGFVTILARAPLDVVGVYTAEPPEVASSPSSIPGIALEILNIAPRIESVPGGTLAPGQGPAGQFYEYSAKFLCFQPEA